MHGTPNGKDRRWQWQNVEGIREEMVRSQQNTRVWDRAGSHRIRHGFYQQAALILGTEGSVADASTR